MIASPWLVDPSEASRFRYTVPPEHADALRVPADRAIVVRECFGRSTTNLPGPQGIKIEAPAHSVNGAHFHPIDQFQIYFPSAGAWYQRTPIDDILVHYSDAYSTYGPLGSAGPGSIHFFTLRAFSSITSGYMPKTVTSSSGRGDATITPWSDHHQTCRRPARARHVP